MSDLMPTDGTRWVPVCGGSQQVAVRPWTLAQRDQLRPLLGAVLARVQALAAEGNAPLDLAGLFLTAEAEILTLVKASVELPAGLEWGQLRWEDLPSLAQAVWETSIVRGVDGGLLGKMQGVLAQALIGAVSVLERQRARQAAPAGANGAAAPSSAPPT